MYIIYIYVYICIYDGQREKTFLKIFRPDTFFSYLYKTLFTMFTMYIYIYIYIYQGRI